MNNYYSQFGEDKFLIENGHLPKKGFFVDVGAGDPFHLSNTYYLEKNGWDGICIDADPRHLENLKKHRKRVVKAIVGNIQKKIIFKQAHHPDLSRIDIKKEGNDVVTPLGVILENEKVVKIDLLSIDVEGYEINVLESFNIEKIYPTIIILEYITPNLPSQEDNIKNFFEKLPYSCIKKTQANLIFKLNKNEKESVN